MEAAETGSDLATSTMHWDVLAYDARSGFRTGVGFDDLCALLGDGDARVWLDVTDPTEADTARLREAFGFHPLAIEDVLHPHQRPKFDQYNGHAFLVLYAAKVDGDRRYELSEIDAFVGRNYLVTIHRTAVPEIDTARHRWRAAMEEPPVGTNDHNGATDLALYVLFDSVVDAYFPILDDVSERLDSIEDRIFVHTRDTDSLPELVQLRKHLMELRRVFAPMREVVNILARREADGAQTGTSVYFLDVYDHLARAIDGVDVYRDMVATTLSAQVSLASHRLNETMRTMTALATILMTMALVTGIYGMNFEIMPELKWQYGYLWGLGLMVLAGCIVALIFRRRRWL